MLFINNGETLHRICYYDLVRTSHHLLAVSTVGRHTHAGTNARMCTHLHTLTCTYLLIILFSSHMKMNERRLTLYRFKFMMKTISPRTSRRMMSSMCRRRTLFMCVCAMRFVHIYSWFYFHKLCGENEILTFNAYIVDDVFFSSQQVICNFRTFDYGLIAKLTQLWWLPPAIQRLRLTTTFHIGQMHFCFALFSSVFGMNRQKNYNFEAAKWNQWISVDSRYIIIIIFMTMHWPVMTQRLLHRTKTHWPTNVDSGF